MIGAKASTLITKVETELSQVSGLGTQLYSDDRILQLLNNTFMLVSRKLWWPELMQWNTYTLDGTTGRPTTATPYLEYQDIRAIFGFDRFRGLAALPRDIDPSFIAGNIPRFREGKDGTNDSIPFQIRPFTAQGTISVHGRVLPSQCASGGPGFVSTDTIPFDPLVLIYGSAFQYVVDDGSNPGSIDKFKMLFERALQTQIDSYNQEPIELDPRIIRTPYQWLELP